MLHRARHDSDLFNRWQALNGAAGTAVINRYRGTPEADTEALLLEALGHIAFDTDIEPAFAAQALSLPSEHDIARLIGQIDADRVHTACSGFAKALGASNWERTGWCVWPICGLRRRPWTIWRPLARAHCAMRSCPT